MCKAVLQPAKRCRKPNAGQSKNPKDDTHTTHISKRRWGQKGFAVAAHAGCSKCFRRLISITFKLRFRFYFIFFYFYFFKSFALKLVQPAAFGVFAANWREFDAFFGQKRCQTHFATEQLQQRDICFNWMDNLATATATAMTSKTGCLDQLTLLATGMACIVAH